MRRHVLRTDGHADFVPRFVATLPAVRELSSVSFAYSHAEDLTDDVRRHVAVDAAGHGTLSVLVDLELEMRWVEIEGDSAAFERAVDDAVVALVQIVPLRQLRGEARRRPDEETLVRLARGAQQVADAETLEILVAALASDHPARLCGAAMAARILRWPELLAPLEAASAVKRTARVKRALREALAAGGARTDVDALTRGDAAAPPGSARPPSGTPT